MVTEVLATELDILRLWKKYGEAKPLRRIIELAYRRGARAVIEGSCQTDDDYLAEVGELKERYGLSYLNDPLRLDFTRSESDQSPHVGYAILRPAPKSTVLRAVIGPPPEYHASYLTCGHENACDLREVAVPIDDSTIWGCEFTQQDGLTGVCAHACLHSVSRYLHERYGTDVLSFADISRVAGCDDPADGLIVDQIEAVLSSLNCKVLRLAGRSNWADIDEEEDDDSEVAPGNDDKEPELGEGDPNRPATVPFLADEVIYRYIESELPVIALIKIGHDLHTLFVVGHSFEREAWWPEARDGYYPRLTEDREWLPSSLWANSFYLLDDNFGPYMSMPRDVCREHVIEVLIPVPTEINLNAKGEAVEALVAHLMHDDEMFTVASADENACVWKEDLIERQSDGKIVLRTLLVRRENFRESVARADCVYSPRVKEWYAAIDMPEWIWLVEVTAAGFYGSAMTKLGEVIVDPTADEDSFAGDEIWDAIVAIHLPGVMWIHPAETAVEYVDGDQPSKLYSRPAFSEHA